MLVLRREVMDRLLANHKWSRKLSDAKTYQDAQKVIKSFAKVNRFKIKEVF